MNFSVFPNPGADLIAIQVNGLNHSDLQVDLTDMAGKKIRKTVIRAGQTIAYFDVQTLCRHLFSDYFIGNRTQNIPRNNR